jgi:hypothetical protein
LHLQDVTIHMEGHHILLHIYNEISANVVILKTEKIGSFTP